jgi:hypothetical protein
LEGVGVKRAPQVALSYLKFAANMGDLASQERKPTKLFGSFFQLTIRRIGLPAVERLERNQEGYERGCKMVSDGGELVLRSMMGYWLSVIDCARFSKYIWVGLGLEGEF